MLEPKRSTLVANMGEWCELNCYYFGQVKHSYSRIDLSFVINPLRLNNTLILMHNNSLVSCNSMSNPMTNSHSSGNFPKPLD